MNTPIEGHLLTPTGFVRGRAHVSAAGRIERIDGEPIDEATARADRSRALVLPGFIDLHVHGGGGADVMDAGNAIDTLAALHARCGTTSLLATTMTAPLAEIEAALRAIAPRCTARAPGAARVLGVHLEGPYLAPARLGAQPPYTRLPTLDELRRLNALAPIRVLTLAPELEGALALIPALVGLGMRVQLGHSQASCELAEAAFDAGASSVTHLFNAMGPFHHRAPGLAGAALASARHAELIPDLLHVHPTALRAALRAIPGAYAVTDATAAAGMPDGEYRLGRQTVRKCADGVRLADGTLAGSTLTMDAALRHLVALGFGVAEASMRCSTHAARHLGLAERGVLAPGAWADAVALDAATLEPRQVWIEGERVGALARRDQAPDEPA